MGTNLQAQKQQLYMVLKKKNYSSRALCKSGRAQDSKGRVQHPQKYAYLERNTGLESLDWLAEIIAVSLQ